LGDGVESPDNLLHITLIRLGIERANAYVDFAMDFRCPNHSDDARSRRCGNEIIDAVNLSIRYSCRLISKSDEALLAIRPI
jgi:hypothetical protein